MNDPSRDASFHDAGPGPLALRAETPEELPILSALAQDAVLTVGDIHYDRAARTLALLVSRFRWEDVAERAALNENPESRPYERARALLVIRDVTAVRSDGIDKTERDTVLSLLALDWTPGEDGTGTLILTFAGDGALAADCECLTVDLRDVNRPHKAVSGHMPRHEV
ncbi:DUF2948 family protein [Paracoccus sp. Z118]|uniref:DUF2948 family protein n=1 Tax=Paracoccus sp. Z118 TaxID=2851017 RepID=UPI001C2BB672|nr:DUF2948 family protein [Paracoccus sp. Z118]MBV0891567.1 DUF2948 family protein [Paracoccus sp. Z118]